MTGNHSNEALAASGPEARRFERTRIPLSAKLLDIKGTPLFDCTIIDLSVVGAQISIPNTEAIPDRVFVVEITNGVAYEARVAWWRPSAAGLAFQEVYKLDDDLPTHFEFLKQALIEAKLEQVDAMTAGGASLTDALRKMGLSGTAYARWNSERRTDNGIAQRLWELEAENASLRKLLFELTGDTKLALGLRPEPFSAGRPISR